MLFKANKLISIRIRCIQTTATRRGRDPFYVHQERRVTKFTLPNKDSQWDPMHIPEPLFDDYYNYPIHKCPLGIKHPGFWFRRNFVHVKEMEPELIVPDLTGFKLMPYVSHRTPEITQSEFTAKTLFNKTYATEIVGKYIKGEKFEMKVTSEDIKKARIKARQTGADLFSPSPTELYENDEK